MHGRGYWSCVSTAVHPPPPPLSLAYASVPCLAADRYATLLYAAPLFHVKHLLPAAPSLEEVRRLRKGALPLLTMCEGRLDQLQSRASSRSAAWHRTRARPNCGHCRHCMHWETESACWSSAVRYLRETKLSNYLCSTMRVDNGSAQFVDARSPADGTACFT